MKILLSILASSLVIYLVDANNECFSEECGAKLKQQAFVHAIPNTEEMVGSKMAFVTYPGLQKELTKNKKVIIKVFGDSQRYQPFLTYTVPENERDRDSIYYFGLDNANPGQYRSQLCLKDKISSRELCSSLSAPSAYMDMGTNCDGEPHSLPCTRELKNGEKKNILGILAPVSGLVSDAWMKSNASTLLGKLKVDYNQQIVQMGEGMVSCIVIKHPLKYARELVRMPDLCNRKFFLVLLSYLVNKETKQVLKMNRFRPFLDKSKYEEFLGINVTQTDDSGEYALTDKMFDEIPDIPIPILMDVEDLDLTEKESMTVWHVACAVRKDGRAFAGMTRCAEPFIHTWDACTFGEFKKKGVGSEFEEFAVGNKKLATEYPKYNEIYFDVFLMNLGVERISLTNLKWLQAEIGGLETDKSFKLPPFNVPNDYIYKDDEIPGHGVYNYGKVVMKAQYHFDANTVEIGTTLNASLTLTCAKGSIKSPKTKESKVTFKKWDDEIEKPTIVNVTYDGMAIKANVTVKAEYKTETDCIFHSRILGPVIKNSTKGLRGIVRMYDFFFGYPSSVDPEKLEFHLRDTDKKQLEFVMKFNKTEKGKELLTSYYKDGVDDLKYKFVTFICKGVKCSEPETKELEIPPIN